MTIISSFRNLSRACLCYNGYARKRVLDRFASTKRVDVQDDYDKPFAFLGTDAAKWKAEHTRTDGQNADDYVWYKPYVVSFSVAVFMLYFCVFREENDVDRIFDKTLYDHIPDLEKEQLLQAHHHSLQSGESVNDIEKRLKEILILERQNKNKAEK